MGVRGCMHRAHAFAAVLACALALGFAASTQAQIEREAGYIPNELVDAIVDLPLQKAQNVFDVYQVIVDLLQETYRGQNDAIAALSEMEAFIQDHREHFQREGSSKTVEMPMPIDAFMRILRQNSPLRPGASRPNVAPAHLKADLYAAICLPFLQCRGVTYRVRPMLEQSYFMHTATIGALRALKQRLDVASGQNGLAVFEFLTYPMAHKGEHPVQFQRPSDVQVWLEQHMIPTLDVSIALAEDVRARMSADHTESINLAVFLESEDPFPDPEMRTAHRYFSRPEVDHFISRLYRWRATLRLACAYHLDDFPSATNELRQVLTRNFFEELTAPQTQPRIGTTSKMRFAIYERYPQLFTLRDAQHCRSALVDFQVAWQAFDRAMRGYMAERTGRRNERLVNLRWVQATYDEYFNKVAPEMQAVLNGRASLQDYVGGAVLDIDLAGALTDPPQDLKDFFPSAFDDSSPARRLDFSSGTLHYTNYNYGNALGWKAEAAERSWKKLFPNLSDATTEDGYWNAPHLAHRDLSRTYVGNLLAPILWAVIH